MTFRSDRGWVSGPIGRASHRITPAGVLYEKNAIDGWLPSAGPRPVEAGNYRGEQRDMGSGNTRGLATCLRLYMVRIGIEA